MGSLWITWAQATNRAEHAMTRPALLKRCNNRPATINLVYPRFPPAASSKRGPRPRRFCFEVNGVAGAIYGRLAASFRSPDAQGVSRRAAIGRRMAKRQGDNMRVGQFPSSLQCPKAKRPATGGKTPDFPACFTQNRPEKPVIT